jgi:uncharacterized protein YcbX
MMAEKLNAAQFTDRGLLGDRAYAFVDGSDGKVAGANNPRKWPELFDVCAGFVERPRDQAHMPPVRITLPGGILLHRHLDTLRELCPQRRFEVWRSRPNVLVQTTDGVKDFVENGRIGHTLAMGARVRLSITGPCPRCVITSVVPSDLPRHPGICAPRPRITRSTLASTRRSYAAAWSAAVMRSGWSGTGYR